MIKFFTIAQLSTNQDTVVNIARLQSIFNLNTMFSSFPKDIIIFINFCRGNILTTQNHWTLRNRIHLLRQANNSTI